MDATNKKRLNSQILSVIKLLDFNDVELGLIK